MWASAFVAIVLALVFTNLMGGLKGSTSARGGSASDQAVAWDDAAAYANSNEAFRTNPDSVKSDGLFAAAHRCQSALFTSRTMVAAPN